MGKYIYTILYKHVDCSCRRAVDGVVRWSNQPRANRSPPPALFGRNVPGSRVYRKGGGYYGRRHVSPGEDYLSKYWAKEGDAVQMNHILSVTGDPRAAIPLSLLNEEGDPQLSVRTAFVWSVFSCCLPVPLFMVLLCGPLVAIYLPILIGVPVAMNYCCGKQLEKEMMNFEGDFVEVDELASSNLMAQPTE